jgi:hypothetical protein
MTPVQLPEVPAQERLLQMIAHRACHSAEHDPLNGRIHGYCMVCGIPWPCEYVGPPPPAIKPTPVVAIVCDWKGADPFPRFIESEIDGRSVAFKWRDRPDGLLITQPEQNSGR